MPEPLLVRAPEAARMLGISKSTLWARVAQGRCPGPIRWDGVTVWRVRDLEEFVERLADQMADQADHPPGKRSKNMALTG
ncbi:helix-turn-helix transcriptional regulator [Roseovarius ramblicola]|uniref:Helix-turn-helix transcriptional regulator n=1 Tax=Roseovarius ramblicola TaxID=2022336 RepID=A0ABV5I022_9RHOB